MVEAVPDQNTSTSVKDKSLLNIYNFEDYPVQEWLRQLWQTSANADFKQQVDQIALINKVKEYIESKGLYEVEPKDQEKKDSSEVKDKEEKKEDNEEVKKDGDGQGDKETDEK